MEKEDEQPFTEGLAEKILTEFNQHGRNCETLLVHCSRGENRGPAVAVALNEIFNLGHNTSLLKERYPEGRKHVYETLKKVAERLFILEP